MKNKTQLLFWLSLSVSLFVYLFYRSNATVVNELFRYFFSEEIHLQLKHNIKTILPLPHLIIFSLPEGLWVLAATIVSLNQYIQLKNSRIQLVFLPILIATSLELFQLLGITNGTFDWWDLIFAVFFGGLGYFFIPSSSTKQNVFQSFNKNSLVCLGSYLVLYLAHVSA